MYTTSSPQVLAFVAAFQRVKGHRYPLTAVARRKYISVDRDGSGVFLIECASGRVYHCAGYGKRGSQAGTLENLTKAYEATERMKVVG